MLMMSPSFSGLALGMPWQTTWLTEVQIALGKPAVVERGGNGIVAERELHDQVVEVLGRDPGLDVLDQHVERAGGELPGLAHALEGFASVQLDLGLARL